MKSVNRDDHGHNHVPSFAFSSCSKVGNDLIITTPSSSSAMVVRSGFEVQLVNAETKVPFKEHEKDGKIYVEAEPDAEYFISARRITRTPQAIMVHYSVDGKELNFVHNFTLVHQSPVHVGIKSVVSGIERDIAFKFAKPRLAANEDGYQGGTGKVEVTFHEAIPQGNIVCPTIQHTFSSAQANAADAGGGKKKFLLSTQGSNTISRTMQPTIPSILKGFFIGKITLNYCSALGMMEAGVISKPDLWAHQRMKRPALELQATAPFKKMRDPANPFKEVEVFDLTED